ncbi:MAG: hypothetical protein EBW39_04265 [Betaproteobacteria bacterium]|nr:hypothetical protein [Betaproteobacteria bacterium]
MPGVFQNSSTWLFDQPLPFFYTDKAKSDLPPIFGNHRSDDSLQLVIENQPIDCFNYAFICLHGLCAPNLLDFAQHNEPQGE